MKTEGNEKETKNYNLIINENNLKNQFVMYVNILSESIKEYYKVSINIIQNKNVLINILEGELFKIIQQKYLKKIKEIINKIKLNINSEKSNLIFFFEDAKITFKEMKNYQDTLKKIINQDSYVGFSTKHNELLNNFVPYYQCTELNYKNENNQIDLDNIGSNFKKIKKEFANINEKRISAKQRVPNKTENMMNKSYNAIDNITFLGEMENLKKLNKNYELRIKQLNFELQKIKNSKNSNNIDYNDENHKIQGELTLNKDKIIALLKEELKKINRKNNQLINNCRSLQARAKSFKEENNKLNSLIYSNRNIINKLKAKIQKNDPLKENNDLINISYFGPKSDFNYNVNLNKINLDNYYNYNDYIILKKKINFIKKKNISLENQIKEKKKKD